MPREYKPYKIVVKIPVEINLNSILEGYKPEIPISDLRTNIGQFIREELGCDVLKPGDKVSIPEEWQINTSLLEFDVITSEENW